MNKKYNKRKYRMQSGVQQVYGYTPQEVDYSEANALQAEQDQKVGAVNQGLQGLAGKYAAAGQIGSVAGSLIKNNAKNKKAGAMWAGGVETGLSGAAAGANIGQQIGGPYGLAIGAGVGLVGGAIGGAIHGKKSYDKVKREAQKEESRVAAENTRMQNEANFKSAFGNYTQSQPITAQSYLAKKGKYKVKTKQPRLIETEGREPIFSPKKKDGTRDLLYYNPNDPTHEEGGVKAIVMPRKKYSNGTSNLKSQRKHSVIPEITPPTPYELMPKPPRSRFNKDSKTVKVYR